MTKHRSPDERAEQILNAARTCFLEKGYFATKMDEIVQESGLSKGGIYFHFKSKREIFRALVQHEYDATMGFINNVLSSESDIASKLVELAEHFVALFASSDRPRFMVIIVEMGLRDEEIATLLRKLQVNYFERVAQLLDAGIESGEIREVDSYAYAVVLKALVDGAQANFALGIDLDFERVVGAAVDLLVRGFAPDR
jgi:AcrR family transcriptional regulator